MVASLFLHLLVGCGTHRDSELSRCGSTRPLMHGIEKFRAEGAAEPK
jgi:hypothetical protein